MHRRRLAAAAALICLAALASAGVSAQEAEPPAEPAPNVRCSMGKVEETDPAARTLTAIFMAVVVDGDEILEDHRLTLRVPRETEIRTAAGEPLQLGDLRRGDLVTAAAVGDGRTRTVALSITRH
jgi:hypothetical protein